MACLARGDAEWKIEEARARAAVAASLSANRSVVLYTSREVIQNDGAGGLAIGQKITDAICSLVRLGSPAPPL